VAVEKRTVPSSLMHRVVKLTLALGIGLTLSLYAYHRVTDPEPAVQRAREEAAVLAARDILRRYVAPANALRIVDPVSPRRKVGKSYIYPTDSGWEISGHYRRGDLDRWHPFLIRLHPDKSLAGLSVKDDDATLAARAREDARLTVQP
jgi:hypothetical protein